METLLPGISFTDKYHKMKNKARKLTLCKKSYSSNSSYFPCVLIKGKWFEDCGFSPGDQVIITNPEPHTLVMTVHKSAEEVDKERSVPRRRTI